MMGLWGEKLQYRLVWTNRTPQRDASPGQAWADNVQ